MQSVTPWLLTLMALGLGCSDRSAEPPGTDCSSGICTPSSGGSAGTTGGGSGSSGRGGSSASGGATSGGSGGDGSGVGGDGASGGSDSAGGSGGSGGSGSGGASASGGTDAAGGSIATGGTDAGGSAGGGGISGGGGSAGCQGTDCGPVADLDMEFYKCNVEPIFDRSCAMLGCHGSESRPFRVYARGRLRNDEDLSLAENPAAAGCLRTGTENLAERGTANVMCEGWTRHTVTEWQKNFDNASSFMRVNMDPEASELLTQATVGGRPHVGIHPLRKDDAKYDMIRRWLSGERLGTPCNPEFN